MFKLFRNKVQHMVAVKNVDTNAVIAEIHNEFDTAGEKLLNEAKLILSKEIDVEKGNRLKNIGFAKASGVLEAEKALEEKNKSEHLAKTIEYYSQWYPCNKFITEEVVKMICEKYNLYFAEVRHYKGDVPDKNVSEIESFKLREEDLAIRYPYRERQRAMASLGIINRVLGEVGNSHKSKLEITLEQWEKKVNFQPPFKICAPESDFDTTFLEKKGHKLELHIPDPIVLQPVNGGYLIVSKWGLEASDATLVNEKSN